MSCDATTSYSSEFLLKSTLLKKISHEVDTVNIFSHEKIELKENNGHGICDESGAPSRQTVAI